MPSLNQIIDTLTTSSLSQAISIEALFSSEISLSPVEGPHIGLQSSDNLLPKTADSHIAGIWLQQIDLDLGKTDGRIMPHNHGDENIDEIVITENDCIYAGIPVEGTTVGNYTVFVIPAGTQHGSETEPSFGRWVSIKFHAI